MAGTEREGQHPGSHCGPWAVSSSCVGYEQVSTQVRVSSPFWCPAPCDPTRERVCGPGGVINSLDVPPRPGLATAPEQPTQGTPRVCWGHLVYLTWCGGGVEGWTCSRWGEIGTKATRVLRWAWSIPPGWHCEPWLVPDITGVLGVFEEGSVVLGVP